MYKFVAGQRKTLLAAELKCGTFTHSYDFLGSGKKPVFLNLRNGLNAEYWIEEAEETRMYELGKQYLDQNFFSSVVEEIERCNHEADGLTCRLNDNDIRNVGSAEKERLFKSIYLALHKVMGTIFLSQDYFTKPVEEKLLSLLQAESGEERAGEWFNFLIKSPELDGIISEQIQWIDFVISNSNISREQLLDYGLKNGWIIYNSFSADEIIHYFRERLDESLQKGRTALQEEKESILKKNEKEKQEFYGELSGLHREIAETSGIIRRLSHLRLEVKKATNSLEVALNMLLLNPLAQENGLAFIDLLDGYFYNDVMDLIRAGRKVADDEMARRKEFVLFLHNTGELKVKTGPEARERAAKLLAGSGPDLDSRVLVGQTASRGQVRGVARIINLSDNQELAKDMQRFQSGEIIVTIMTQPNIMPIAQKAAGIVTDEGGLCSHAAIISRELKIPCVVGTEFATKLIKDGDMIEVNGETGQVTII